MLNTRLNLSVLKLYYKIWVDLIYKFKANAITEGIWKMYSFVAMSMAMYMNILLFAVIFERLVKNNNSPVFLRIAANFLDTLDELGFVYPLMIIVINSLLIFYSHRYEKLIVKYKNHNGKLGASIFIFPSFYQL